MRSERWTLAVETGLFSLPDAGRLLVLNARADDDLTMLPAGRTHLVQGFRPDHDALAARGLTVSPDLPAGPFALSFVCLPRAREAARAMVAAAAAVSQGPVVVDGQKTDGIDSLRREVAARVPVSEALAKAHGKVFTFAGGADLSDWAARPHRTAEGFTTQPGVFSADGADRGSALLAAALPAKLKGRGVDLGAGWGYLAAAALAREGVTHLDLVEAEADALTCARLNIIDSRAAFHWADATRFRPDRLADWVICNPPFHLGRAADPGLGEAFLRAAARMLATDGTLWLVANRHLPYDRSLVSLFREVDDNGGDATFRLTRAARPLPASGRRGPP